MPSVTAPRPGIVATRIARLLRPAAAEIDAWVSTEAAVQLPGQSLLRPAVVVVKGELPYDGVTTVRPLLVVEVEAEKVARWMSLRLAAVWGPYGDDAVEIAKGARRVRTRGETLTVRSHASLSLPVTELLQPPPMANVTHLPR